MAVKLENPRLYLVEDDFLSDRCDPAKWQERAQSLGADLVLGASDDLHDVGENSDDDLASIRLSIATRYCKVTNLCNEDSANLSYAYYTEGTKRPGKDEHNPIYLNKDAVPHRLVPAEAKSAYKSLDCLSQDKLYIILATARSIWKKVQMKLVPGENQEVWVPRPHGCHPKELCTQLANYGTSAGGDRLSLLASLQRGRKHNEVLSDTQSIVANRMGYHGLDSFWIEALTCGMRNGSGRAAVHCLIDRIAGLIPGLKGDVLKLSIINITSPFAGDAFSVTSSSSSKPKTRGSLEGPPKKRPRLADESDLESEDDVVKCATQDNIAVSWPKKNCQFVDMSVVGYDRDTGVARYLLVIEIHSRGKTEDYAVKKFTKAIVHVLQSQNLVYGLFFSEQFVRLYKATRNLTGLIQIAHQDYQLYEGPDNIWGLAEKTAHVTFCAANFQRLVMDIFSCFVDGMKNIDT